LQQEQDVDFSELRVTLWHDSPGMAEKVFLGEVRIPLSGPQQQQFAASSKW
jgi:Ras GTPase-activating protein 3